MLSSFDLFTKKEKRWLQRNKNNHNVKTIQTEETCHGSHVTTLQVMTPSSIYSLKKKKKKRRDKHVFTGNNLTGDWCCSLHPPKLKTGYSSSAFISHCGLLPPQRSVSASLELELFVLLGTASCVLWLGLPLLLLYGSKNAEMGRNKKKKKRVY